MLCCSVLFLTRLLQVPDYYEIVKEPIDLTMILNRINAGDYYITLEVRLVCVCLAR